MLDRDVIKIGTIRRTHGKSGELQCHAENELWENADAEFVFLDINAIYVPFRVTDWRTKGAEELIFRLKGVDNEVAATRLVGCDAYMLRSDVAAENAESLLTWQDLTGAKVIDTEQGELGVIRSIDETTANILAELTDGRLLPLHEDFIVDVSREQVTITLPFELS